MNAVVDPSAGRPFLKLCPFCGGRPVLFGGAPKGLSDKPCYIECWSCGIRTSASSRADIAINFWNARVPLAIPVVMLDDPENPEQHENAVAD